MWNDSGHPHGAEEYLAHGRCLIFMGGGDSAPPPVVQPPAAPAAPAPSMPQAPTQSARPPTYLGALAPQDQRSGASLLGA